MHAILALSAVHISRINNKMKKDTASSSVVEAACKEVVKKYTVLATQHLHHALSLFTPLIPHINPSNCDAIFAFASVITIIGFAFGPGVAGSELTARNDRSDSCDRDLNSGRKSRSSFGNKSSYHGDTPSGSAIDDLLQIFHLARGVKQVLSTSWHAIRNGKFGPVMALEDKGAEAPERIERLIGHLKKLNMEIATRNPLHETESWCVAIDSLKQMWEFLAFGPSRSYVAIRWPISLPQICLAEMATKEPFAMVVLAHFCLLLEKLEDCWCMEGWGIAVVKEIWKRLSTEEKGWAREVIEMIGVDV